MTVVLPYTPAQVGAVLPAAMPEGLSDDEQALITQLAFKLAATAWPMKLRNDYYEGTQRLADLGISIPPQMAGLRTVVDWPRICVDPLVQRCVVEGFRLPKATDVDSELWDHWQANDLDAEAPLCFLDAFVYGRGYMVVGSPDTPGDSPVVTVESPLNMTLNWDPRTRATTAAYQSFEVEGIFRAVLYLPNETIFMSRQVIGQDWQIDERDQHNMGEVPVVRFANRQRASDREGRSEITPAVMNTTDSACRSLLGMEIAREFYSIPHRWGVGLNEDDFLNADGTKKTSLDMAMSKFLAFSRNGDGDLPVLGQFTAFDPSVFTKIINEHAQLMASYTQFPPAYFGITSTANPASADAIRVAESGVDRRGKQAQHQFSDPLVRVQRLVWRFANGGGQIPVEMRRLEADWTDSATQTPAATSDAIAKQIQTGSVPARSDVVLKRLGYSGIERARMEIDRQADPVYQQLAELASSLEAKQARTDLSVAHDINPKAASAQPGDAAVPPPQN